MVTPTELAVLCCRASGSADGSGDDGSGADGSGAGGSGAGGSGAGGSGAGGFGAGRPGVPDSGPQGDAQDVREILLACAGRRIHYVGRRPGKAIDPLLAGRILVIGDDADLAAVVLRLLRRDLLRAVEVAYATPRRTAVTSLWSLPTGPEAVVAAERAEVDVVPLVRSDAGGVLVGSAQLSPVSGTVYVDAERVLSGAAPLVHVEPDREQGLAVTVVRRRALGFGRRPITTVGRAVEFGLVGQTAIISDGVRHPRQVNRWVFYKHTDPLRLVRGVY